MVSIVASFATLLTVHVALSLGFLWRRPWWHAPFAFVLAPLAPIWGFQEGMRRRASLWILAFVVYVVAVLIGRR